MFLLKALYVRIFTLLALLVTLWGGWQLMQGQWLWLAPVLTWTPLWLLNLWRFYCGNVFFQDDREYPVMGLALLGIGLVLVLGERSAVMWWAIAGLFGLLLYVFIVSSLSRGVRESIGDKKQLSQLAFVREDGERVSLEHGFSSGSGSGSKTDTDADTEARWLIFFHSASCPYARMAMRELMQVLVTHPDVLPSSKVVAIFPDRVPSWGRELQALGGQCWVDQDGDASGRLGLWLRGGNMSLGGGRNALRPALAVLDSRGELKFWEVAKNFRLPPSMLQNWARLSHL